MATKAKTKAKAIKKAARRASAAVKSIRLKAKRGKAASPNGSRNGSKRTSKGLARRPAKLAAAVESKRNSVATGGSSARSSASDRQRSKHYDSAVQAYEAGIKLLHAEEFERAIRCFQALIAEYPEEPEIQERSKVLLHLCEKRIQEKGKTVLRTADDYYNVGIAELNRRELDRAIDHLQHALKLMPKSEYILYALATANALQGNRDGALNWLKQSIHHRSENRFLAARDGDFASLQEDPEFKQLVTSSEK